MIGQLIINGQDAYSTWGVVLEAGSYARFLSGSNMKPYTTNHSRSIDGKIVSMKNPRLADRDLTIVFIFTKTSTSFISRYNSFISTLRNGQKVGMETFPNNIEVPELGQTFKLIYLGDLNMENYNLEVAKVAVKFNEPNPTDR